MTPLMRFLVYVLRDANSYCVTLKTRLPLDWKHGSVANCLGSWCGKAK